MRSSWSRARRSSRQLAGGVRGQVQSESPTEVVVALGNSTTSVPTDQIVSIRYDGQPATIQLAETRESAGQLAEAADLFKKAAAEAADRPYVMQMALYREASALADLALVEPGRAKDAKDKLIRFVRHLSQQPAHHPGPRRPGPAATGNGRLYWRRGHDRRSGEAAQRRRPCGRVAGQGVRPARPA